MEDWIQKANNVVAEFLKTLDRTLVMRPICGKIVYEAMIAVVGC